MQGLTYEWLATISRASAVHGRLPRGGDRRGRQGRAAANASNSILIAARTFDTVWQHL